MPQVLHRPTPRQSIFLAVVAAAALTYGFVVRYLLVEDSTVGIACGTSFRTWLCATRSAAIAMFTPGAFGLIAVAAALLNLLRPSMVLWTLALAASGAGLVLYNAALSGLAVALLILSLARPAPEAS